VLMSVSHPGGCAPPWECPDVGEGAGVVEAKQVMHFRNYEITPDPAAPSYGATCVSGGLRGCGADSGDMRRSEEVGRWIAQHVFDTGHERFQRRAYDFITAELGHWV